MERLERIRRHQLYKECMDVIDRAETDRIYCLHNLEHSLDVARIAYILSLEQGLSLNKELIYTMALLHDLGRSVQYRTGENHHQAGGPIARQILMDCGYSEEEIRILVEAVIAHQAPAEDKENPYRTVLYQADKLSRNCYHCKASDTCYWKDAERNHEVRY